MEQETTNSTIETEKCEKITRQLTLYDKRVKILDSNGEEITYSPKCFPITKKYSFVEKVYEHYLAPAVVYQGLNKETEEQVAIKRTTKSKLTESYMKEFIVNELTVHQHISKNCGNIVKVLDYFEDSEFFYMVMEFCDRPNYFEDILETVSLY